MPGISCRPASRMSLVRTLAVRADHEPVRLVAQPLDEIEHGVARLELDRLAVGHEQGLAAGVAVRPLGDRHQRDLGQAKGLEDLARGVELAAAPVDDDEVGPLRHRSSSALALSASVGDSSRLKRRSSTSRIMP